MSDISDLIEVALHLQAAKALLLSERFVPLLIVLDKATDLVAQMQDQDNLPKFADIIGLYADDEIPAG